MSNKAEDSRIVLPEGRVINHSLMEKDQYNDKAKPSYKIELAFDAGQLDDLYEALLDAAVEEWGEGADAEDANLIIPIKNGDAMAADREANGKNGEAYKGKEVIRANTIYNRHGEDAPGGVNVYDAEVKRIEPVDAGEQLYRGMYGVAAVTISTYIDQTTKRRGLTLYLSAFQKTRDGDRIAGNRDHSDLFEPKPVGRSEGAPSARRKRAG